jgi:branched-chain amino acid transport system ATP-binding protein
MLKVNRISNSYGDSHVLFDVSLEVGHGEVVSLLGRNGMGKTTTIASIMGILPIRGGDIRFGSRPIHRLAPYAVARCGIGLVPESRRVFDTLTVRENLVCVATASNDLGRVWTVDGVLDLFPALAPRLNSPAGCLSGGEQQMLAIGRALMTNPKLMLLDEATEGLAPLVRVQIWRSLAQLKTTGMSILVVDKNLQSLLNVADRHYILEKGRIVWSGSCEVLRHNPEIRNQYLSVTRAPNVRPAVVEGDARVRSC